MIMMIMIRVTERERERERGEKDFIHRGDHDMIQSSCGTAA